jgi:hypothetical protein
MHHTNSQHTCSARGTAVYLYSMFLNLCSSCVLCVAVLLCHCALTLQLKLLQYSVFLALRILLLCYDMLLRPLVCSFCSYAATVLVRGHLCTEAHAHATHAFSLTLCSSVGTAVTNFEREFSRLLKSLCTRAA